MEKNKNRKPRQKKSTSNTEFERIAWESGAYLCGIDEVGRGCLAGPVITAAVILKPHFFHDLLVDSKILPEKKRLEASLLIFDNAWYAYGIANQEEVDNIGIYQATQNAMLRSLYGLFSQPHAPQPSKILIDAIPLQLSSALSWNCSVESFCYGESRSISIAAASIIAKVFRDELMKKIDTTFHGFDFTAHKGYGTALHTNALTQQGIALIHRKTFIKEHLKGTNHDTDKKNQSSLFW